MEASVSATMTQGAHEELQYDFWSADNFSGAYPGEPQPALETKMYYNAPLTGVWKRASTFLPPNCARRIVFRNGCDVSMRQELDNARNAVDEEQLKESFLAGVSAMGSADTLDPGSDRLTPRKAPATRMDGEEAEDDDCDEDGDTHGWLGVFAASHDADDVEPTQPQAVLQRQPSKVQKDQQASTIGRTPKKKTPDEIDDKIPQNKKKE